MKYCLFLFSWLVLQINVNGQASFPHFLIGTWQVEGEPSYETWDVVSDSSLRGLAYKMETSIPRITEYLDLGYKGKEIVYTANVLLHNKSHTVPFVLKQVGNIYSFENPLHDFPKKIVYQFQDSNTINISLEAAGDITVQYRLLRIRPQDKNKLASSNNPNYDANLAEKLGGDEYGMKPYFLVILKTGSYQSKDKKLLSESFESHMTNIQLLVEKRKMIVAGPLKKNDNNYRGIFIFQVSSREEVIALLKQDETIRNGIFDYEIYDWYGSAALPIYLETADQIWKNKP